MTDKRRLKGVCRELYVTLGGDPSAFDGAYPNMERAAMESIKGAIESQRRQEENASEIAEARDYMRRRA